MGLEGGVGMSCAAPLNCEGAVADVSVEAVVVDAQLEACLWVICVGGVEGCFEREDEGVGAEFGVGLDRVAEAPLGEREDDGVGRLAR